MAQDEVVAKTKDKNKEILFIYNKYISEYNNTNSAFRNSIVIVFIMYNILRYFENTELGNNQELQTLVNDIQSMNITTFNIKHFNILSSFIENKIMEK
jgi:hypothetical protein